MKWLSLFQCLSYRFTVYRTAFTDECDDTLMCDSNRKDTAAAAKSLQSCPTLCDPIDGSPPGSPFPGILQARSLEWVAISFSSAWKWKVKVKSLSQVRPSATPWTAAYQAPPSMGFSRQEYWSGVPLPSPSPAMQSHPILCFFLPHAISPNCNNNSQFCNDCLMSVSSGKSWDP